MSFFRLTRATIFVLTSVNNVIELVHRTVCVLLEERFARLNTATLVLWSPNEIAPAR